MGFAGASPGLGLGLGQLLVLLLGTSLCCLGDLPRNISCEQDSPPIPSCLTVDLHKVSVTPV